MNSAVMPDRWTFHYVGGVTCDVDSRGRWTLSVHGFAVASSQDPAGAPLSYAQIRAVADAAFVARRTARAELVHPRPRGRRPMSWLSDRAHRLLRPWDHTHLQLRTRLESRMNQMERRMTLAENAAYARAAEVVGLIRAEFASLRQQVADAATAGAVALEADAQADADRITGLVDELASVLPATVPDVPVPDPGQPAELPADTEPPTGF